MNKADEIILELEEKIAMMLTENYIEEKDIRWAFLLMSALEYGPEYTEKNFGGKTFFNNMRKNNIIEDNKFIMTDDDSKYIEIWFLLAMLGGLNLIKRTK